MHQDYVDETDVDEIIFVIIQASFETHIVTYCPSDDNETPSSTATDDQTSLIVQVSDWLILLRAILSQVTWSPEIDDSDFDETRWVCPRGALEHLWKFSDFSDPRKKNKYKKFFFFWK